MKQHSMTALVSNFARGYHAQQEGVKIYDDTLAYALLTQEERAGIAEAMSKGIAFFNPTFAGTKEEALRHIVENQLAPTPLGRAAFAQAHLQNEVRLGVGQYLIFAAGYDTFAYRQPRWARGLTIIEIDLPDMVKDKKMRLERAGIDVPDNVHFMEADLASDTWLQALRELPAFDGEKRSFCSLLGISYYLTAEQFEQGMGLLQSVLPKKSSLVFDYPAKETDEKVERARAQKQRMLAAEAQEEMQSSYTAADMEHLLARQGFLVYEHLTPEEITKQGFGAYNRENPTRPMRALDNVNYLLAVKE